MFLVRAAQEGDIDAMSRILRAILTNWGSDRPWSPAHVRAHYVAHPDSIKCSVALSDAGDVLGFQSLRVAAESNPYDLPKGWGIIGTYVDGKTGRSGVGRALFASTLGAARAAGLRQIDATIGKDSPDALAYYEAMGFRTYKTLDTAVCKKLIVN